jgi:hypothetical protein
LASSSFHGVLRNNRACKFTSPCSLPHNVQLNAVAIERPLTWNWQLSHVPEENFTEEGISEERSKESYDESYKKGKKGNSAS